MVGGFYAQFERMVKQISARGAFLDDSDSSRYNTNSKKNNLTKSKQFGSIIRVGRILESDVWPTAKAMCVPCFANKCRIIIPIQKNNLLIRQLNIEHFQMPANKPLACCPLPSPLPREREQVSAAGKRI
jgi:hypothetical protein